VIKKTKTTFLWLAILLLIAAIIDNYLFFSQPMVSIGRLILSNIATAIVTSVALVFAVFAVRRRKK